MNNRWLIIRQLDEQLKEWQRLVNKYGSFRAGWVKTLRTALNMSAQQLGNRLGLTRERINQLEKAEVEGAVTLRTLKKVANAMGCDFVYAIVPKNNSSLENIIKERADLIAKERVSNVAHTMSLESQTVSVRVLKKHGDILAKNLSEHLNKKFWSMLEKDKVVSKKSKPKIIKKK